MTVYIDEIFAVNLIMDWLILYMTGNLAQHSLKMWRITAGAVLGAIYSIAVFMPHNGWLSLFPAKVSWSVLMLMAAYPFVSWWQTGKLIAYFYLISFAMGGASIAAMYLFSQPAMQTWSGIALIEIDFKLFWLLTGVFLIIGTAACLRGKLRQNLTSAQAIADGMIQLDEQAISLRLLIDNGHSLTDPLTGKAVLIVSQKKILPLFPGSVQALLQEELINTEIFLDLAEQQEMAGKWRLIPYQTVGQQGTMLGFRADKVTLQFNGRKSIWSDILVMLSPQQFSADENFQGLVPPELL